MANFSLSVLTDLKQRGVVDILIACIDGLVPHLNLEASIVQCLFEYNTLIYLMGIWV
ncbi:hypothetical protein SF1_39430 [Sphingobacterium faecium NBRC 15299]|nr:hypothetical protein C8N37_105186 [Sphingobacterium faecium]GEM65961.1 hypothetical protein SF1_39430 [Sphingobacterium faecium NBRC 15299]